MTAQSFFATIAAEATAVEQDVVAGVKTAIAYVDNVIVTDIEPALAVAFSAALALIENNGGTLLLTAAQDVVNGIADGTSLADIGTQVLTAAKAAGATTVAAEEALAAQTAVTIAQAVKAGTATA